MFRSNPHGRHPRRPAPAAAPAQRWPRGLLAPVLAAALLALAPHGAHPAPQATAAASLWPGDRGLADGGAGREAAARTSPRDTRHAARRLHDPEKPDATVDPAALCDAAALRAAAENAVPPEVMLAITRVETGRRIAGRLRPWPWAVNVEGKGRWFATRAEAEAHLAAAIEQGRVSADAGCFQINYRWHGMHFPSSDAMFDPLLNARHAARFLAGLEAGSGDWAAAAGAYHSRTPALAARYRQRFEEVRAALEPPPGDALSVARADTGDAGDTRDRTAKRAFLAARPGLLPPAESHPGRAAGSLVVLPAGGAEMRP